MIAFLKAAAKLIIPTGMEYIMGGITMNAVKGMSKGAKITAAVASAVAGWWIGDMAEQWLEDQMDELKVKIDEQYKLKGADE